MTDPIADMLSRIMNTIKTREDTVDIPHSKIKEEIAKILLSEGYIENYENLKRMEKNFIRIKLKYRTDKTGVIVGVKRVSTPGRRRYSNARSIPRIQSGFGTAIVSTSKGIMTDSEARAKKHGGEVLCYIW